MLREPKFETSLPDFVITKRKIFCVIFSLHEYEITLMLCTKICIFHKIIQNTKKDIYIYIYLFILYGYIIASSFDHQKLEDLNLEHLLETLKIIN